MAMGDESRDALTDSELARIAKKLREIAYGSSWLRTLSIGELVLKHFFLGRVDEWRTHRAQKEASIRRLARRPDCPLGKSALSDSVAIYVARKELPAFVDELTPSHVALALRLPPVQRLEILRKAFEAGWSMRVMRAEVLALKRRAGERRGRPRFSEARAALSHISQSAEFLATANELLAQAGHADEETLTSLGHRLSELELKLADAREGLCALVEQSDRPGLRSVKHSMVASERSIGQVG